MAAEIVICVFTALSLTQQARADLTKLGALASRAPPVATCVAASALLPDAPERALG